MSAYNTANLVPRQRLGYNHTLDVWRPTVTATAATTYGLQQTAVPWMPEYTPNINSVSDFGPFKEFTMLVLDKAHVPADADITLNDICVVTTITNGKRDPLYGTQNRMNGEPSYVTSVGRRRANKKMLEAMSLDQANATILAAYT